MNPETAPCINGPKLAAWLRERDRLPISMSDGHGERRRGDPVESLFRRVDSWANGSQADLESADRWLTFLGLHISELPDDFWEEKRKRKKSKNYSREEKAEVLRLIQGGATPAHVARDRGISAKTVWSWRSKAAA